ncbi:MAG: hypothetical protein M3P96_16475 [Actinomycetota bacterium]|nr:hypothetical protein [Actinomycetota bacterium]
MEAVLDTSSWISLARAGLLPLLERTPIRPVLLDVVHAEAVAAGLAGQHSDAAAIETVAAGLPVVETRPADTADAAVLTAARDVGVLVTNDLALGRRAKNVGVLWLRTPDLILLAPRGGEVRTREARHAVLALRAVGRITSGLAASYLEELT